jgi:dihydrofolate reductase
VIVALIVAVSENGGIGKDGKVPWHLTDDLKNFKRVTMGHHLIVGRKTFESIGKALPGRKMVVVSRNEDYEAEGCEVVNSLEAALGLAFERGEEVAFVAGGAEMYALALPLAKRMHYTQVLAEVEVDTFFPAFDEDDWKEVQAVSYAPGEGNEYGFVVKVLERKP